MHSISWPHWRMTRLANKYGANKHWRTMLGVNNRGSNWKPRHTVAVAVAAALVGAGGGAFLALSLRRVPEQAGNSIVPQPAKSVDLTSYLGRWYELGRYPNRFEGECEGVTAEYSAGPYGTMNIVNACRDDDSNGMRRLSKGRARTVNGSGNAKFKVSFFGPFFFGNYWVLDHASDYAWSIVGEPSGRFLWILSRDPAPPRTTYDMLIDRARSFGYDMTRFRRTRQLPI